MKFRRNKHSALPSGVNPRYFHKSQLKIYAIVLPIAFVMALPLIFILINAFKPVTELMAYPPRFYIKNPTLSNFMALFDATSGSAIPFSRYLFNSIISTVITVFGQVWLAASVGYVLSKKYFKSKNIMLKINMLAMSFITTAVAIPRYFIIVYTGLHNNFLANIIPLLVSPTCIFLTKQFIDQIPNALIEAAVVDGATDFQILRKVIIPLIKPTLATVAILTFQSAWGSTEASTLFIENESLKTFAYYMSILPANVGDPIMALGVGAAGSLIMFLPNLIIFIFMQSKVMDTMASSGIK